MIFQDGRQNGRKYVKLPQIYSYLTNFYNLGVNSNVYEVIKFIKIKTGSVFFQNGVQNAHQNFLQAVDSTPVINSDNPDLSTYF